MILSLKNIKAVIFDMDGTMVNNAFYHELAWKQFLKENKINLSQKEYFEKISGKRNDQTLKIFFPKITSEEIIKYSEEKENIYRKLYSPYICEVKGLRDIITKLSQKGIKLAVSTTAPKENRDLVLKKLNLFNVFDLILGEEDVTYGKPDPEIYEKTAKMLDVKPEECIVFEDSPVGVQSAKKAGMRVIGVLTTYTSEQLSIADFVVDDYTDVNVE